MTVVIDDGLLAETLTAALFDDPFYRAIVVGGEPVGQRARLTAYFVHSLAEGRAVGMVDVTDDGRSGAAIWTPPAGTRGAQVAAAIKHVRLSKLLTAEGWAAYAAIGAFSHAWVAEHVPVEAWYLSILGVSPERHGSGLGSQLVRAGLRRVDVGRRPAYVETFNPRSVPFYERHGFATVATGHESTTGRPFWLLLRPGRDKA